MVIFAALDTDVCEFIRDSVDRLHRVKENWSERGSLILKDLGGRNHVLAPSGTLYLYDIQCPENPVVRAITSSHRLEGKVFVPNIFPSRMEYNRFPTLFELERVAVQPATIGNILSLSSDGSYNFSKNDYYFIEQERELKALTAWYSSAVRESVLGKPVLEGFYQGMLKKNVEAFVRAYNPDVPELGKQASLRSVRQEDDFLNSFGENLYRKLRDAFGEPKFRE